MSRWGVGSMQPKNGDMYFDETGHFDIPDPVTAHKKDGKLYLYNYEREMLEDLMKFGAKKGESGRLYFETEMEWDAWVDSVRERR